MSENETAGPRFGHGCIADEPDPRDYPHPFDDDPTDHPGAAKAHVDLSTAKEMPEVWNQKLNMESCVAHTVAAAWVFAARRAGKQAVTPSRLFIWYHAQKRQAPHSPVGNKAVSFRKALQVLYYEGAPPETLWEYHPEEFVVAPPAVVVPPPDSVRAEAERHKAKNYFIVTPAKGQTMQERLKALLEKGLPICFSFTYFPAFVSPKVEDTGEVPMPTPEECAAHAGRGRHAALLVGYDDETQRFKARNSYGPSWGQQGYFTMPYEYVCSPWGGEGDKFWTLRLAY